MSGASATHARNDNSKSGKERISSSAVQAAAAHSTRVGSSGANCIHEEFSKRAEKKFFVHAVQADCEWSNRRFLTQKDRKRHRRSDKIRPAPKTVERSASVVVEKTQYLKMREDPVISDRVYVSGGSN
jgi:hypothetical protein